MNRQPAGRLVSRIARWGHTIRTYVRTWMGGSSGFGQGRQPDSGSDRPRKNARSVIKHATRKEKCDHHPVQRIVDAEKSLTQTAIPSNFQIVGSQSGVSCGSAAFETDVVTAFYNKYKCCFASF